MELTNASSVMIMDVTNSSAAPNRSELGSYLQDIVKRMHDLSDHVPDLQIRSRYRGGDEIILVADGFSTAYVIAYYIRLFWKFDSNLPYFGGSFGYLEHPVREIDDIEAWIHPYVKSARTASEQLKRKNANKRPWLNFDNAIQTDPGEVEEINELVQVQDRFFKMQTPLQRQIGQLYSLYDSQGEIATVLNKPASSISRRLHDGNTDLILKIRNRVIQKLRFRETGSKQPPSDQEDTHPFDQDIRKALAGIRN